MPKSKHFLLGFILAVIPKLYAQADYSTPYAFTTLAGVSSIGSQDGVGSDARFYSPEGITTDSVGNVYITDEGNHVIRKITPDGVVSTFAGSAGEPGNSDGPGSVARFDSPQGIVADTNGNLFVTDTGNHTIRKITPEGVVTTLTGLAGVTGNVNGPLSAARFNRPRGIAINSAGTLYVTETGNSDIRQITPAGEVTTFAQSLWFPEASDINAAMGVSYGSIAVDLSGNVYVSCFITKNPHTHEPRVEDYYEDYIGYLYKITPDGIRTWLWQTTATHYFNGHTSGVGGGSLTIDLNGQLIFSTQNRIYRYAQATGSMVPLAGDGTRGGSDGPASTAKFGFPLAMAYDHKGTLYIADTGNNVIRKLSTSGTVTTLAGLALENAARIVDDTGHQARLQNPTGVAIDAAGNVYVAERGSHCIRKITPTGAVSTLAGTPGVRGFADGMGTAAQFSSPYDVTIDSAGIVYVTDSGNHAIRRITPLGQVSTLAGDPGHNGFGDGTGNAARFNAPTGIVLDSAGNLIVADYTNRVIRKITPAGEVTTIAGTPGQSGNYDSSSGEVRFASPTGMAIDAADNIYVSETLTSPAITRIRKISRDGIVTTLLSSEPGYQDGNKSSARFHEIIGIEADATANLFIIDSYNQTIRKLTPAGAVSTVGGLADAPGSMDGSGRNARFYYPQGIAIDRHGKLYVTSGTTVRQGALAGSPLITIQPQNRSVTIGGSVQISISASGTPDPTYQWYFNGQPLSGATSSTLSIANARTADAGDYTVVVTNDVGSTTSDIAKLTVTGGSTPSAPAPSSSSGGGGGGSPSLWFVAALAALGLARRLRKLHLA